MADDREQEEQQSPGDDELDPRRRCLAGRPGGRSHDDHVGLGGGRIGLVQLVDGFLQRGAQLRELGAGLHALHGLPRTGLVGQLGDAAAGLHHHLPQRLGRRRFGVGAVARDLRGEGDELLGHLVGESLGALGGVGRARDLDDVPVGGLGAHLVPQLAAADPGPVERGGHAVDHDRTGRDLRLGHQLAFLPRPRQQYRRRRRVSRREQQGGAEADERAHHDEEGEKPSAPTDDPPDRDQAYGVIAQRRGLFHARCGSPAGSGAWSRQAAA